MDQEIVKNKQSELEAIALYRLPGKDKKHLLTGWAEELTNGMKPEHLEGDGFVFEPFDKQQQAGVYIHACEVHQYEVLTEEDTQRFVAMVSRYNGSDGAASDYEQYKVQFETMFDTLNKDVLEKVILSRTEAGPAIKPEQVLTVFDALAKRYAQAFVYVIYTPLGGLWMGAGPELLLSFNGADLSTVSLAGTLPVQGEASWQKKELVEQQLVTDYVNEVLGNYPVRNLKRTGPDTIKAGQVRHLCTRFSFELGEKLHLSLLYDLHPTPAVCGRPKQKALEMIRQVESHDRSFYAGFIGPVHQGQFEFYVNLRCLQVMRESTRLFVGGGLTVESQVQKEWDETELKAQTLLAVLKNIQPLQ